MIWYVVAFLAGVIVSWKLSHVILKTALNDYTMMRRALQRMNPDAFARLRKEVETETTRRNTIL